jgi:flagellar biosynthesis/type III secretory pathway protein FliH
VVLYVVGMMMTMKKNDITPKHKPPSRERYEQKKPVVSIRMPKELQDDLIRFLQETGRSRVTFIRIALNQLKADHKKAFDQGYDKGYKKGYDIGKKDGETLGWETGYEQGKEQGKKDWAIWGYCMICGKLLYITPNSKEHRLLVDKMKKALFHPECFKSN